MSQWSDRFDQHPVHKVFASVQRILDSLDLQSFKDQELVLSSIDRLRQVFTLTKTRLDGADAYLVPISTLNNLNSAWQAVSNELSNFSSNKNVAHLTNANAHVDSILPILGSLVFPLAGSDLDSIKDSATSYRRTVGQYLHNMEEEARGLHSQVATIDPELKRLASEVTSLKQRTDSVVNNFQQQFSAAEDKRRSDFQASENERKRHSDQLFSDMEGN